VKNVRKLATIVTAHGHAFRLNFMSSGFDHKRE
jgi:hypothetical protein